MAFSPARVLAPALLLVAVTATGLRAEDRPVPAATTGPSPMVGCAWMRP